MSSSNEAAIAESAVATLDSASLKRPAVSRAFQAKKTRVLVLGAGMSGLACARELQQRGYHVLVVEARDRLGGRLKGGVKTNDKEGGNEGMKTLPTAILSPDNKSLEPISKKSRSKKDTTTPVDLGGALIHGIIDNPIYALTEQMGIPTCPVSECLLFNGSGWPVDTKEDERISAIFNECLEETFVRVAAHDKSNLSDASASSAASATASNSATSAAQPSSASPQMASTNINNSTENRGEQSSTNPLQGEPGDKLESETVSPPILTDDENQAKELKEGKNAKASARSDGITNGNTPNPNCGSSSGGDDPEPVVEKFGDVFEKVCKEKSAPTSYPLFQWHQANLEVSCGASFPDLGYKWNDDEPYGFDGDHVAVQTSWNPVVEGLAEGIDILYQSPVKKIILVVPDPPPETKVPLKSDRLPDKSEASQPVPEENVTASSNTGIQPTVGSAKNKRKRPRPPPTATPLPSRRSRRLRGDDADARRSSRANKGQKVDRFLVTEFSRESYEGSGLLRSPTQRSGRQRQEDLEPADDHTTVQVTLEDGTVLEAEAVVCTVPLGILKLKPDSNDSKEADETEESPGGILFHPPLSERKQQAIERLGCGLLNKCVLSFSHVFWQDSDFLGLAHPANSYLVLNVATFTNKPILTFMYGGTFAKEIEAWTDNEIVADCMEVLRIICGKRDIPNPLDYTVTRWGHERFSRMSFSYVPPGVDGMQEFKAMSEAVYDPLEPRKPVLMFAGEHTTPFHPSTIHGAFLSGIREAYRLDLFVEAEANGNLEFEDEQLYQHTFAVRRQFQMAKSPVARAPPRVNTVPTETNGNQPSPDTKTNGSKRQHRRRGAASVMNLRERPRTILPNNNDGENPNAQRRKKPPQQEPLQPNDTAQNGLSVTPARRSRRSLYAMQNQKVLTENSNIMPVGTAVVATVMKKAPISDAEALLEKKYIASLESRTLMRALESYGHNYPYIQSIVLPVFGNTTPLKTLPQVRARCQQLIRSIISSASAQIPKRLLTSWVPKKVHVPPPPVDDNAPTTKKTATKSSKPPVEGARRSSRQLKARHLMNL